MGGQSDSHLNGADHRTGTRVSDRGLEDPTIKILRSHHRGWGFGDEDSLVVRLEHLFDGATVKFTSRRPEVYSPPKRLPDHICKNWLM